VTHAQRCDFLGEWPNETEAAARRSRDEVVIPLVRYAALSDQ
jgi:hypothetical protein